MYSLYIKKSKNKLISSATPKPFSSEGEFEKYLMETKDIFSDIFILKRQVNAGRDILDMVGIDRDNNIVIIENKNIIVTEDILPQILRYAIWAETNPDSIRAMWLEAKDRPEDIEIDWTNVGIKIMILAPSIKLTVPRLIGKIDYNVELVEIKRFFVGGEEIVLLNKLEEEDKTQKKAVRGLEVYDRDFQKTYRNPKSVGKFFDLVDAIEKMVKKNGWNLEKKLNKYYVGFKFGFLLAFGIHWIGSRSFEIFFKVQPNQLFQFKKICPYTFRYDRQWKQAVLRPQQKINIIRLRKTFAWAYNSLVSR